MSVAHLIDEARSLSHYEGSTLVIFNRPANDIRLTLEWDDASERWRGECSDASRNFSYLAPVTTSGGDDVMAVAGALNAYLDALNGFRSKRDRIDSGDRWARENVSKYGSVWQ